MHTLVDAILQLGSSDLATESAAIAAIVRARWPGGPRCGKCGAVALRDGVRLHCSTGRARHRSTIFVGTPLARLRRPRARALLLGIRAFACTSRGISALELAREVAMPVATLWRHLHLMRALLPQLSLVPTTRSAAVQVCGKYERGGRTAEPGFAVVGVHAAQRATRHRPKAQGRADRLTAENTRAFLIGTHHGVRASHLASYLREAAARGYRDPRFVTAWLVAAIAQRRALFARGLSQA